MLISAMMNIDTMPAVGVCRWFMVDGKAEEM